MRPLGLENGPGIRQAKLLCWMSRLGPVAMQFVAKILQLGALGSPMRISTRRWRATGFQLADCQAAAKSNGQHVSRNAGLLRAALSI